MCRLCFSCELVQQVDWDNQKCEDHERDYKHNESFDPVSCKIDLCTVCFASLSFGFLQQVFSKHMGDRYTFLHVSGRSTAHSSISRTRMMNASMYTCLDKSTIEYAKQPFNCRVQPGMLSSRTKRDKIFFPVDERAFLLDQWLLVVHEILNRSEFAGGRFIEQ